MSRKVPLNPPAKQKRHKRDGRKIPSTLEMEWEESRDANNQRIFIAQDDLQPSSSAPRLRSSTSFPPIKRTRIHSPERGNSPHECITNNIEDTFFDPGVVPVVQISDPGKDKTKGARKTLVCC